MSWYDFIPVFKTVICNKVFYSECCIREHYLNPEKYYPHFENSEMIIALDSQRDKKSSY